MLLWCQEEHVMKIWHSHGYLTGDVQMICVWSSWCHYHTQTHTHRLTALFLGLPGWASTRKVKAVRILLKQETVSGNGINWAMCKSTSRSRHITMPVPHHSSFFYRPEALLAAQPTASKHWRLMPLPLCIKIWIPFWCQLNQVVKNKYRASKWVSLTGSLLDHAKCWCVTVILYERGLKMWILKLPWRQLCPLLASGQKWRTVLHRLHQLTRLALSA